MHAIEGEEIQKVTCVAEGIFADALTYATVYDVIVWDKIKRQMKIRGENSRTRWYPSYCFAIGAKVIPRLVHVLPCDPIDDPAVALVEVDIALSNGERRWCDFVTPAFFSQLSGQETFGAGRLLLFDVAHMIVVSAISQEMIEASLKYIERQGRLLECTRVIDTSFA